MLTSKVLLGHHGCPIVADSFDVGFSRAVNLEAAAMATYQAHVLGAEAIECPPKFLAAVEAQEAAGVVYGKSAGSGGWTGLTRLYCMCRVVVPSMHRGWDGLVQVR